MKTAIMQPYFFPYIGYFQMLNAVDTFVFLDNVNFIKRGWVHRNKISINGKDHLFSIPLTKASQNKLISEIELHKTYDAWKEKFKKTLFHAYKKSKNFDLVYPRVVKMLGKYGESANPPRPDRPRYHNLLYHLCEDSIKVSTDLLGIFNTKTMSSYSFSTNNLTGESRILRICQQLRTSQYINAISGKKLYNPENFKKYDIALRFIKCELEPDENFTPYRSILDLLFRYPLEEVKEMLYNYRLEK